VELLEPFSRVTQTRELAALLGGRRDAGRYEDAGRDQSAGGPGDGEHVDTASPAIGVGPVRAPARSGA
jgi:hypothetical protein